MPPRMKISTMPRCVRFTKNPIVCLLKCWLRLQKRGINDSPAIEDLYYAEVRSIHKYTIDQP